MSKSPNKDVVNTQSKLQNKSLEKNATQFQGSTAKKFQEKFPGTPRSMCQGTIARRRKAPLEYFNQIILYFNGEWYQFFKICLFIYLFVAIKHLIKKLMLRKMNSIIFGKLNKFSLNLLLRQCKQVTNSK